MAALVKVKLLAQGGTLSMVEYQGRRYEVYTNTLQNCGREQVLGGFVNYCYINPVYLTKEW